VSLGINALACDCIKRATLRELDSISYEISDIVLLGQIVQISKENYKIQVIEVLKGEVKPGVITGIYSKQVGSFSNCCYFPQNKSEHLLYLTVVKSGNDIYYYASRCQANRSLNLKDDSEAVMEINDPKAGELTQLWIEKLKKQK
jgi:hypothetical protein